MTDIKTHYRTCNICEAMCGLEIRHRDQEILSIRGDKDDPFSKAVQQRSYLPEGGGLAGFLSGPGTP